jgi:hypothetical protein
VNGALASGPVTLAVVAFGLLTAWCFTNRRVDLTLAALGLYLGLLDGYIKLSTGSPFATLGRDVLVVAIAGGALARSSRTGKPLPIPPLGGLVLAFSALVLVQFFNPLGDRSVGTAVKGIRQHLEFVPLFFLGYAFIRSENHLQKLMLILVLCAGAGGFVSYVQSTLTPEQFADWGPGYSERVLGTGEFAGAPRVAYDEAGEQAIRPFGLGSDIGGGAVAATLALPALIVLLMAGGARLRLLALPLGIGIALAVATSGTRAGIVSTVVSALAFGLLSATSKNMFRGFVGLIAALALVYGAFQFLGSDNQAAKRSESIAPTRVLSTFSEERGSSLLAFGGYAIEFPLGLGIGSSGPAALAARAGDPSAKQYNSETEWNFLVIELGLFGVAIFLALTFRVMGLALTRIRHIAAAPLRLQLAALAAPMFGLFVADFAGSTTTSVPPAPYLWLITGVLSYWLITRFESLRDAPSADPPRAISKPRKIAMRGPHEAPRRLLERADR